MEQQHAWQLCLTFHSNCSPNAVMRSSRQDPEHWCIAPTCRHCRTGCCSQHRSQAGAAKQAHLPAPLAFCEVDECVLQQLHLACVAARLRRVLVPLIQKEWSTTDPAPHRLLLKNLRFLAAGRDCTLP